MENYYVTCFAAHKKHEAHHLWYNSDRQKIRELVALFKRFSCLICNLTDSLLSI